MTSEEQEWVKTLFLTHSTLMFKIAAYRLQDEERANNLVQEVFLLLMVKLDRVMTHENPAGWLFEALRRSILAEAKQYSLQRDRERPLEDANSITAVYSENEKLSEVLPLGLREKDREILLLYFEEGLSHKEIAECLGISEGTCYTRLCRAKERYQALIEEKEFGKV